MVEVRQRQTPRLVTEVGTGVSQTTQEERSLGQSKYIKDILKRERSKREDYVIPRGIFACIGVEVRYRQ